MALHENDLIKELLDLFDEILVLAEQQLAWFKTNTLLEGDVEQLTGLAAKRQELMQNIDEKLAILKDNGASGSGELSPLVRRIMAIDNQVQEKAQVWMRELKKKMHQGGAARQANQAYGGDQNTMGAAFFDGRR